MIYLIARQAHGEEWKRARAASREAEVKEVRVLSHRRHVHRAHPVVGRDRVIEVGPLIDKDSGHLLHIKRRLIAGGWPAESIEWEPTLPPAGGMLNLTNHFNIAVDPSQPKGKITVLPSQPATVADIAATLQQVATAASQAGTSIRKAVREVTFSIQDIDPKVEEALQALVEAKVEEAKKQIKAAMRTPQTKVNAHDLMARMLMESRKMPKGVIRDDIA